jgi:hypothetical protein
MKAVFEALPHINEVWVTEDGNFHLHSSNGGKLVTRDTAISVTDSSEVNETEEEVKPIFVPKERKKIHK